MITMYSTGCPRCEVLKTKLQDKNIEFNIETDIEKMKSLGILEVPKLEVDNEFLSFKEAVDWVNQR